MNKTFKNAIFVLVSLVMIIMTVTFALADVSQSELQLTFNGDLTNTGNNTDVVMSFQGSGGIIDSTYFKLGNGSGQITSSSDICSPSTPTGILTGNKDESFGGWFNITTDISTANQYFLFWDGDIDDYDEHVNIDYIYNAGNPQLRLNGDNGAGDISYSITLNTSQWYHVFYTYNSSTKENKLYFEGNLIATTTKTHNNNINYPSTRGAICVGGWASGYGGGTANFDDFRYYDDVILTPENITEIYNNGTGTESNPVVEEIIADTLTSSIISPLLTYYNSSQNIDVNVSVSATNLINCTLTAELSAGINTTYTNNSINTTTTPNIIQNMLFNGSNEETSRYLGVFCTDGTLNATDITTLYFDDVVPRLVNSTYNGTSTKLDSIEISNLFADLNLSSVYTQLEDKFNETNSSINTANFTYNNTVDITYYGIGTYNVTGTATDVAGNSMSYLTSFTINPDSNFLTITAYNYLNLTPLTLATIYVNSTAETQIANPFQHSITNYLSKSIANVTTYFNMTDFEAKHIDYEGNLTIDRHTTEFNISMNPSQLYLQFNQSGSLYQSKGFIADTTPQRFDFFNSSIVVIQQELATGYVHVRFGDNSSGNWTQYYEYINDETEHISEVLEVLQNADDSIHVQVLRSDRVPLEDVKVRVQYMQYSLNSWQNGQLLGQRLTDGDGQTFFIADSSTQLLFTFTKEGYLPVDYPITVGDEPFTRAEPLEIFLEEDDQGITDDVWWYTNPYKMYNDTESIYTMVLAQGKDSVKIQSDYMVNLGISPVDLTSTCDSLDRCTYTFEDGSHFDNTQNVVLYLYIDNTLIGNRTIEAVTIEVTEVFEKPDVDQRILVPILLIALLFVTAGMSLKFRSRNVGVGTWTGGTIVCAFLSDPFVIIASITVIGVVYKWIYGVIKE